MSVLLSHVFLVEPTEKEVVVRRLERMKEVKTCLHRKATFDIVNCVCVLETEFQKKKKIEDSTK